MIIEHNKRQLKRNLIIGFIWLAFFIISLIFSEKLSWINIGWGFISLMYFGLYFYQKKYKYLSIKNGIININGPLGKKLKLSELKQIRKFAGDYILKSDGKELSIDTQIINTEALLQLDQELEKLNVEWC